MQRGLRRNIWLLHFIYPLSGAWFWLGVWLLWYLQFTDYSGVGLLEMIWVLLVFTLEIPSGAISDMIGRKKSLLLGFFLNAVGNVVMALAGSFGYGVEMLALAIFMMGLGGVFLSGSMEALIYDSLKTIQREGEYDKILSRYNTLLFLTMGVVGAIGGVLYQITNPLPFLLTGVCYLLGTALLFFIQEPPIDTVKINIRNYLKQNIAGFKQLFANTKQDRGILIVLFGITALAVPLVEILDTVIVVEEGLDAAALGLLFGVIPLVAAAGNSAYIFMNRRLGRELHLTLIAAAILLTVVVHPFVGLGLGIVLLLVRNIFYPQTNVMGSRIINEAVESKYRATSLSSYSLLINLPYLLFLPIMGASLDSFGIDSVLLALALIGAGVFLAGAVVEARR
ncbi:MAG: MFS transporter [Candidatus Dojkabacteria bacterium]